MALSFLADDVRRADRTAALTRPQTVTAVEPSGEKRESRTRALETPWLTYQEAADYCGWSVAHLRKLVSAGEIPVYGKPRVRRFRRDMLDLFLTNPDAAMREFRSERIAHGS